MRPLNHQLRIDINVIVWAALCRRNPRNAQALRDCKQRDFHIPSRHSKRLPMSIDARILIEQPTGKKKMTEMEPFLFDLELSVDPKEIDLCGLPW
jgi:hypothetical protein